MRRPAISLLALLALSGCGTFSGKPPQTEAPNPSISQKEQNQTAPDADNPEAQEVLPGTASTFIEAVWAHDPQLLAEQSRLQVALADLALKENRRPPELRVGVGENVSGTSDLEGTLGIRFFPSMLDPDSGDSPLAAAIKNEFEARILARRATLAHQVKTLLFTLARDADKHRQVARIAEIEGAIFDVLRDQVEAGVEDVEKLLDQQIRKDEMQSELQTLQTQQRISRRTLATMAGLSEEQLELPEQTLQAPSTTVDDWAARPLRNHEALVLQAETERNRQEILIAWQQDHRKFEHLQSGLRQEFKGTQNTQLNLEMAFAWPSWMGATSLDRALNALDENEIVEQAALQASLENERLIALAEYALQGDLLKEFDAQTQPALDRQKQELAKLNDAPLAGISPLPTLRRERVILRGEQIRQDRLYQWLEADLELQGLTGTL